MSEFSEKQIQAAIGRIPTMASTDIRALRERARAHNLDELAAKCDAALAFRPFDFSADVAKAHEAMSQQVKDMNLVQATLHAFTKAKPASADEIRALRWMAMNPGGDFQSFLKDYGKGDLGLVIGHLVYDRYGCFKQFMVPGSDQSSVLLHKDRSGNSVRYTLRPEALEVFTKLGLLA